MRNLAVTSTGENWTYVLFDDFNSMLLFSVKNMNIGPKIQKTLDRYRQSPVKNGP